MDAEHPDGHWITLRYARQALNLTDAEISALPRINVEAPNGVSWGAANVPCAIYHDPKIRTRGARA